jgi:hypothetical protein
MTELAAHRNLRIDRVEDISARRSFWSGLLFPCWAGSALSLLLGLGISLLSGAGVIGTSRSMAYMTISLLVAFFVLMFLAAHCMDRRDAAEKAERLYRCRERGYEDWEFKSRLPKTY